MIVFEADRKIQVLQDDIPGLIAAIRAALPGTIPQRNGEGYHWRAIGLAREYLAIHLDALGGKVDKNRSRLVT